MFIFLHYFHFKCQLPKMYLICTINFDSKTHAMLFNKTVCTYTCKRKYCLKPQWQQGPLYEICCSYIASRSEKKMKFFGWIDPLANEKQPPYHFSFSAQPTSSFHSATVADCWQLCQRVCYGLLITIWDLITTVSFWFLITASFVTLLQHNTFFLFFLNQRLNKI